MNLHDEIQAFLLGTSLRQALPRYRKDWTLISGGSKQVVGDAGGDSLLLGQPPRFILAASPPPLTDRLCSITHAQQAVFVELQSIRPIILAEVGNRSMEELIVKIRRGLTGDERLPAAGGCAASAGARSSVRSNR